jgi:signal transduction histidine kinase/PAS domain-containing protein
MALLIDTTDWSESPLGPPCSWPQSLKTTVGLMLPAAAQIVLFWGPDYIALYNDAYVPTIGDKHPRALGHPARENWAELWDDLRPLLQSVRDTGETVEAKDRPFYIERHGYPETVYFDISYSAVPDESGGVGGVLCIVNETTERVQAEQQLRDESHHLEVLNRVGSAIASELDLERVVQMVTDAGVELTGAHFGAFFYNVIEPTGESYMLYTLSGVDRSKFERFGMPRNTKVFAPTFAGEGVVRSDDITQDSRYGQNPPHTGMPNGHLPVVSYLAVPVISRSDEVVGGLFFGHPKPGRFRAQHEHLMEGIAAQAAIAIDNARLFRAAQHEIEQRVKAEQALTALNETLESRVAEEIARRSQAEDVLRQAQKMETVGQLSGGIAHDFNNLLQIIQGNLSLLQRSLPEQESKWRRSVENALSGTNRAAALTQRLLAFSRRQPLDPGAVDVNGLIGHMIELLHRTLGETIVIATDLSAELPVAHVDGNQLENAILNLAINARDAMPGGGRLEITTGLSQLDPGRSDLDTDAAPGRYVRIAVRDNGTGMDSDTLSHAVEPFFSTKDVGQGTGLGLSMVYGFVKQSGGQLLLQSREGEGTTVELFLPCSEAAAEPRHEPSAPGELPEGRGERVLLCEDDEGVRLFSGETLRDLGYEVVEATDAGSALAALTANGRIDLLFTDMVLPGGRTGADLAREARKLQPDLKVLFTTGYARTGYDRGQDLSGVELLLKPFSVDELAGKLREMLG